MIRHHGRAQTSKRRALLAAAFIVSALLLAIGVAYANRVRIKETIARFTAPPLPAEEPYRPPTATSTKPNTKPPGRLPTATGTTPANDLPHEKRLAVPFTTQAPHANWDETHNETCEEASILMVREYYDGVTGIIPPDEAETKLMALVAYQNEHYGFFEDTSATETKRLVETRWPDLEVKILPVTGLDDVKQWIAAGVPVIIPADGKALPNPNFRNGGPPYHMLVVRGYTQDHFITNDPGTRKGENFLYTYRGLLDATHDWNGGDVPNGEKVMLVIRPKK